MRNPFCKCSIARVISAAAEKTEAEKAAATLSAVTLTIPGKAGEEGKLFGSVTAADIAEAIVAEGHSEVAFIIVGSGPAGYTAAIYAARAMLEPVLIQGIQPGGQLTITTDVENYPGFADVIQGPWLMEQMEKQAAHVGTKIVQDHVNQVGLGRRPFQLECDSGDRYLADPEGSPVEFETIGRRFLGPEMVAASQFAGGLR